MATESTYTALWKDIVGESVEDILRSACTGNWDRSRVEEELSFLAETHGAYLFLEEDGDGLLGWGNYHENSGIGRVFIRDREGQVKEVTKRN